MTGASIMLGIAAATDEQRLREVDWARVCDGTASPEQQAAAINYAAKCAGWTEAPPHRLAALASQPAAGGVEAMREAAAKVADDAAGALNAAGRAAFKGGEAVVANACRERELAANAIAAAIRALPVEHPAGVGDPDALTGCADDQGLFAQPDMDTPTPHTMPAGDEGLRNHRTRIAAIIDPDAVAPMWRQYNKSTWLDRWHAALAKADRIIAALSPTPGESDTPPWCSKCGCGNDTAGYAHLAMCPTLKPEASAPEGGA